ncbi:MAG: iron-sulfur cluster assembly scaffold protein [Desulfatitalea sp.]|nr:iron-sulfur cluster assembly scaffold protein [Desulfatitalea sp.]
MDSSQASIWQSHSMKFLEMAFRTDRQERLRQADGYGKKSGDCGDTVEFFLQLRDGRITHLAYMLDGCIHTNACANTLITLAEGKQLEHAWEIKPEDVAAYLETLPDDHFHCAELAIGAFYLALADTRRTQQAPWMKAYR